MEKPIITKRGTFGRIQVTIPMDKKNQLMEWYRKSGLGKAEFFRVALMIGATQLNKNLQVNENSVRVNNSSDELQKA